MANDRDLDIDGRRQGRERHQPRSDANPVRDEELNQSNPHHGHANQERLRRMGSMSANRRVLEDMQQQSVIKKYLDKQMKSLLILTLEIVGISLLYFMPSYTGVERDPLCEMNAHVANAWFIWIICGS